MLRWTMTVGSLVLAKMHFINGDWYDNVKGWQLTCNVVGTLLLDVCNYFIIEVLPSNITNALYVMLDAYFFVAHLWNKRVFRNILLLKLNFISRAMRWICRIREVITCFWCITCLSINIIVIGICKQQWSSVRALCMQSQ